MQEENRMTELMVWQEDIKTYPFGDVWEEYCRQCGVVADKSWFEAVRQYEEEVLLKR